MGRPVLSNLSNGGESPTGHCVSVPVERRVEKNDAVLLSASLKGLSIAIISVH